MISEITPFWATIIFMFVIVALMALMLTGLLLHWKYKFKEKQKAQSQRNIRMMNEQELKHKL